MKLSDSHEHLPGESEAHHDVRLVRALLRRERSAVDQFIVRMKVIPKFLAVKNKRLGSPMGPEELADLTQDVLTTIWGKLETFEGRASLETWAFRFCVNGLMNAIRSRERLPRAVPELEVGDRQAKSADEPLDSDRLYQCLDRLNAAEQSILRAKHFRGLTFEEIATEQNIPVNTVKARHYRSLQKLKVLLTARTGEES